MASIGGQPGNHNAEKKQWRAAINRALEKRGANKIEALDALAEKLLANAEEGDMAALKELGDRLDGKPAQAIIGGDEDTPPIRFTEIKRTIVDPKS